MAVCTDTTGTNVSRAQQGGVLEKATYGDPTTAMAITNC